MNRRAKIALAAGAGEAAGVGASRGDRSRQHCQKQVFNRKRLNNMESRNPPCRQIRI